MTEVLELAEALTEAARRMNAPVTLAETLDAIVRVARDSMNGIDHVGITVSRGGGHLETAAATDDFVRELDAVQYELHQGPCVTALENDAQPITIVEHARLETRWHEFIPRAVSHGLRSQMGVRLFVDGETLGVLNCYSVSSDTIDDDTHHLADLLATHAALAYGHVRKFTDLQAALVNRQQIGQAVGIVMERYHLDSDRAFDYLVRVSSTSEVKLRDVAREIVENTGHRPQVGIVSPAGMAGPLVVAT